MENIKWIFFDVGSTLVDESSCYERCVQEIIRGTDISFQEFYERMLFYYRQNRKGDLETAKEYGLPIPQWPTELERPYPQAESCLKQLHAKYHIGIIANQTIGTAQRLENFGLLKHIDLVISSAEEGVKKPDPAIFRLALERAGCLPQEAVMIGDRLDNDIEPVKALGMGTVWLRQGFGALSKVRNEAEKPDFIVSQLKEVAPLFL
ncbi:MAG: HAD family hydrolase [Negativibacillus sp.]